MGQSAHRLAADLPFESHSAPVRVLLRATYITLRWMLRLVLRGMYRIRVTGLENIPANIPANGPSQPGAGGGALIVSNHVSYIDALLLLAVSPRNIRFLIFDEYYRNPIIQPILRLAGCIPIGGAESPRALVRSMREATAALERGHIVGIFAEGEITRIGRMLPFRRGMERIVRGTGAPIVPVFLEGLWGSLFSFDRGRFFLKMPQRFPYPLAIAVGKPIADSSSTVEARQAVLDLGPKAFALLKPVMKTLGQNFVRNARLHPLRFAMADGRTPDLSFGSALVKSIFLARRLAPVWREQPMAGVLLPPSVGGALVNIAAMLAGKPPVNLNYTASSALMLDAARKCGITRVITSRAFFEKMPGIEPPGEAIFLEDLAANPALSERFLAMAMACLLPWRLLQRALGAGRSASIDDLATVIFSSGSTGDPKGVMLSHFNIDSNVEQMERSFFLRPEDRILGVLPFFHSFGFTVCLWLPMSAGFGVIFHPNPLETATIGKLARDQRVTIMVATPTFMQGYIRRCEAEDFRSLRLVLVGAEKLAARITDAFEKKFGITPLEGYGCTECSPVVAVNTPGFRSEKLVQVGVKRGKIGHPLPGISVRIVDPESGAELPLGSHGLLLVKGPNVMQGYLGDPERTAQVLREGWYNTGDIATMDEDGFLAITGRLGRFSKIGGEMVPHIRIEQELHAAADIDSPTFAVTSVPDSAKGERLMVLHTLAAAELDRVLARFEEAPLPALWRPKRSQFMRVESLPFLGTGKLDLRRVNELALAASEKLQS